MRWFSRPISQTEAREALKKAMDGIPAPKPTREGYDKPDGREVIRRLSVLQERANRILNRRRA